LNPCGVQLGLAALAAEFEERDAFFFENSALLAHE